MHDPISVYTRCDDLSDLPEINRKNWEWETSFIAKTLEKNARVLQVGSANGARIVELKKLRPDLEILGVEIETQFIEIANDLFVQEGIDAKTVLGDITSKDTVEKLGTFDWVLCLNHTLGWIPGEEIVLKNMKAVGKNVLISVYGETFDRPEADAYFSALGLKISTMTEGEITLEDFCTVRRYNRSDIESWKGKITDTPLGYACILSTHV